MLPPDALVIEVLACAPGRSTSPPVSIVRSAPSASDPAGISTTPPLCTHDGTRSVDDPTLVSFPPTAMPPVPAGELTVAECRVALPETVRSPSSCMVPYTSSDPGDSTAALSSPLYTLPPFRSSTVPSPWNVTPSISLGKLPENHTCPPSVGSISVSASAYSPRRSRIPRSANSSPALASSRASIRDWSFGPVPKCPICPPVRRVSPPLTSSRSAVVRSASDPVTSTTPPPHGSTSPDATSEPAIVSCVPSTRISSAEVADPAIRTPPGPLKIVPFDSVVTPSSVSNPCVTTERVQHPWSVKFRIDEGSPRYRLRLSSTNPVSASSERTSMSADCTTGTAPCTSTASADPGTPSGSQFRSANQSLFPAPPSHILLCPIAAPAAHTSTAAVTAQYRIASLLPPSTPSSTGSGTRGSPAC